jgi:hypothetical protein
MRRESTKPFRETQLYHPIRDYLVAQGYTVRAEVEGCDIAAYKDGTLVVIELKRQFSVDLLVQATARQAISDRVYVAIPGPLDLGRRSRWRGIKRLLRRLELGLMVVELHRAEPRVQVFFHPKPYRRRMLRDRRRIVLEEMIGRSADRNQGGSTQQKLITAYRENAVHIACCLERYGPLSLRQLRALGTGSKTFSILYKNVYGWFERVGRGIYGLSPRGRAELIEYPDLVVEYAALLDDRPPP